MITADVAIPAQCELAEGPVWDYRQNLLRWVDILAGHVHAFDPASGVHDRFPVGEPVGSVGLTTSGGLVLALSAGFGRLDAAGLRAKALPARIPGFAVDGGQVRFNDGKPDPWGNFWAGAMPLIDGEPGGALYRLAPDGTVSTMIGQVGLSNGLDWADDRRTFYFADSDSGGVDAFDCDPDTGALGARRRFVTIATDEGTPDGLTLDADGCLWLAVWGAGELRRYTPDGKLDTVVRMPASQVSCPAFGPDGALYITTAYENFDAARRAAEPHAGDIFACTPGVIGRRPFEYAG